MDIAEVADTTSFPNDSLHHIQVLSREKVLSAVFALAFLPVPDSPQFLPACLLNIPAELQQLDVLIIKVRVVVEAAGFVLRGFDGRKPEGLDGLIRGEGKEVVPSGTRRPILLDNLLYVAFRMQQLHFPKQERLRPDSSWRIRSTFC